jgi:hypothetical protein
MLALLLAVVTASPLPSPTPEPLRTIVTVRSTTFCGEFATHVNNAIGNATRNDQNLGQLINTLRAPNLGGNDMERRMERMRLNNTADAMYREYRQGESEVEHLRALAKSAKDPQEKEDLKASADALGGVLYRQHLIQRDMDGFLAYLDAGEMRESTNELRLADEAGAGGLQRQDPRTGLAAPAPYWIPQNVPANLQRDMALPGDETAMDDLRMARAASHDFESRLPAIFSDELNAGSHISSASDRCE